MIPIQYFSVKQKHSKDGRVDVALYRDTLSIGIEISVTNTALYEAKNIEKCINAGFTETWMCSEDTDHLEAIKKQFNKSQHSKRTKISFLTPDQVLEKIEALTLKHVKHTDTRVKGYRVKIKYSSEKGDNNTIIPNVLGQIFKPKK